MEMENTKKSIRNSAVERVRIIAMLMIVCSHASFHGGFPEETSRFFANNILLDWMVLGNVGVDIFVFISGYFLCMKELRYKAIAKLVLQVWFYSMLGVGIGVLCGVHYSARTLVAACFPTAFSQYWFFTAYVVLMLFSPCINAFLNDSSRMQLLKVILSVSAVWIVIPTFTRNSFFGNEFSQFVLFYMIGGYFRKYPPTLFQKAVVYRAMTAISLGLLFASSLVLRLLGEKIELFRGHEKFFYTRSSLLVVLGALGIFCWAIAAPEFECRWINTIAGATFGVYLFHDNTTLRDLIWQWIDNASVYHSALLIPRVLASAGIVYLAGLGIELLRQRFLERPVIKAIEYAMNQAKKAYGKKYMKMKRLETAIEKIFIAG